MSRRNPTRTENLKRVEQFIRSVRKTSDRLHNAATTTWSYPYDWWCRQQDHVQLMHQRGQKLMAAQETSRAQRARLREALAGMSMWISAIALQRESCREG